MHHDDNISWLLPPQLPYSVEYNGIFHSIIAIKSSTMKFNIMYNQYNSYNWYYAIRNQYDWYKSMSSTRHYYFILWSLHMCHRRCHMRAAVIVYKPSTLSYDELWWYVVDCTSIVDHINQLYINHMSIVYWSIVYHLYINQSYIDHNMINCTSFIYQ